MPEVQWGSRGAEKVFRDNEQIKKSVKDTGDAYKDTTREAQELGRIATRIAKDNETANERYSRSIVNAGNALDKEKISAEQLNREVTRLTVELLRQTDGNRKLTDAELQKIDVKRRYHEQLNRELMMMPQLTSSTQRLMGEYTQTGASLDVVAAKQEQAFSPGAVLRLLPQLALARQLITGMATAYREVSERAEEAGQHAIESLGAMAELSQVAENPKALQAFREESGLMKGLGIAASGTDAANIELKMKSAGLNDVDRQTMIKMAATGFISPQHLLETAGAAAKVQANYGGTMEGTLDYLTAGATKSDTNLSTFALAGTEYFKTAANLGVSLPEAMAAHEVLNRKDKDVSTSATEVRALLDASMKKGIKFKRGHGAIDDLLTQIQQRAAKAGGNLFTVLGRKEAVNAYIGLKGKTPEGLDAIDSFHEFRTENEGADAANLATQRASMLSNDPDIGAALALRHETALRQVKEEDVYGMRRNLGKAVLEGRLRRAAGMGKIPETLEQWGQNTVGQLTPYDSYIRGEATGGFRNVSPETAEQIRRYIASEDKPANMDEVAGHLEESNRLVREQNQIMKREQKLAPVAGQRKE